MRKHAVVTVTKSDKIQLDGVEESLPALASALKKMKDSGEVDVVIKPTSRQSSFRPDSGDFIKTELI